VSSLGTPLRVGLVVIAAAAAFAVGLSLISGGKVGRDSGYKVFALFDDATGLGVRSRVQIAGIPIGQVEKVELLQETAQARVWIRVKNDVKLHRDATINKRAESILGDFLLDLTPGSVSQPLLKDGDEIKNVVRAPGMNEVFNQLSKIAGDIQAITHSLRGVIASEEGEASLKALVANLKIISEGLRRTIEGSGQRLDDVLANFQSFSADLRRLTSGEKEDVVAILKNTRDATEEANRILHSIGGIIGPAKEGELKESISSIKGTLDKVGKTVDHMESVTRKIDEGQGTIGRLINDDKLIRSLEESSRAVQGLLGRADQLRIELTERSEFLIGQPGNKVSIFPDANTAYNPWTKNYFILKLAPKPDKWYGFEIIDDPRGVTNRVEVVNTATPPSTFFPDHLVQITTQRQLKFSGYIAKRYGFVSGRFGILENTGGFGIRAYFLNDDLQLSADLFEFANPLKDHPRVKLYADYRFLNHLLVTAGVDDLVNTPIADASSPTRVISGRDFFIGAGFYFTDDDLKLLASALALRF
jgi:phospholipid/cholesterol/gamma-HCH transport system substrate-binding protein